MALGPAEVAHGPMYLGGVITILLYGISIAQTYLYWESYKRKDRWYIKYYVLLLFVADTVHTAGIVAYLYRSLIVHFDDPNYLTTSTILFEMEPALSGMISGMVQGFFGWRVFVLINSWPLFIIIEICSIAAFLMGIATAIACHIVHLFAKFQDFQVIVIIWLVCATLGDILITGSLVTHLSKHRTGFKYTDSQIDRIIRVTVQTGMVTAIWALADLLVYLLNPTGMHLLLNTVLPKLYTNSLLSSLNSRRGWRYNDTDQTTSTGKRNGVELNASSARRTGRGDVVNLTTGPEVFIHVESHEMAEGADYNKDSHSNGNWNDSKNVV